MLPENRVVTVSRKKREIILRNMRKTRHILWFSPRFVVIVRFFKIWFQRKSFQVLLGRRAIVEPSTSFEGPCEEEFDSTYVMGRLTPSTEQEKLAKQKTKTKFRDGCTWSFGPLQARGNQGMFSQREFDEFVVYATSQVQLRFLVEFDFIEPKGT